MNLLKLRNDISGKCGIKKMKINEVMELAKWFNESDLTELKWREDNSELKLEKGRVIDHNENLKSTDLPVMRGEHSPSKNLETEKEKSVEKKKEGFIIKSPVVGTFYSSPSPEEASYVEVGQKVKKGDVVCIVEAMKLLNEISSPVDGVVKEIYVKNEALLEYEQNIMRIEV